MQRKNVVQLAAEAPSMDQFYNQIIEPSDSDGPYDCPTHRVPKY
jgi:hypothetical protein